MTSPLSGTERGTGGEDLFIPQSHHRIDRHRSARRHVSGSASDPDEQYTDSRQRDRVCGTDLEE